MKGAAIAILVEAIIIGIIYALIALWATSGDASKRWQRKFDWRLWWQSSGPFSAGVTVFIVCFLVPFIGFVIEKLMVFTVWFVHLR